MTTILEALAKAQSVGIAHNNGAGGQYLLCATEAQLLAFIAAVQPPQAEAAAPVQGEWQPMSTAPKDKLCLVKSKQGEIALAHILSPSLLWTQYVHGVPMLFQPTLKFEPVAWTQPPSEGSKTE